MKLSHHFKKFILLPLTILSSLLIESGKKYFGNDAAISDIVGVNDSSDSSIQTPAMLLTFGSAIMQLSLISYFMWKTLTKQSTHSPPEEKLLDSTEWDNEADIIPLEETYCESCKKKYCSRSPHCVGTSLVSYFKCLGLTTIVPVGILSATLGLQTLFPYNSRETTWFKMMTYTLPVLSSYQYLSYNLINGAFKNIEFIGKAVRNKQYNVSLKPLALTAIISLPCVLLSGPFIYFYSKKAMLNIMSDLFNNQELNTIALLFGISFIPIQAITLTPAIYDLIQDINKHGCKTILNIPSRQSKKFEKLSCGFFSNPFYPLAVINITGIICDASSNLLSMRISAKCLANDFNVGTLTNTPSSNSTSSSISCPTTSWVEICASISAGSAAFLFLVFNLRQLKRLFLELDKNDTPIGNSSSRIETDFSLNAESKQNGIINNSQKFSLFSKVNNKTLKEPLMKSESNNASSGFAFI